MDISFVLLFYLQNIVLPAPRGLGRGGIQFRPKFTITADLYSKYVLNSIQSFLNCLCPSGNRVGK